MTLARLVFVILPRWILATLILAGIALNFANVVSRYVFGSALFWVEEILIFIVVWGVFVGAAAIAYDGNHLRMDLVSARIGQPWRTAINAVTVVVLLACCGFVIVQSWETVARMARFGQVSVAAEVPMSIPHAALLVGFAMMAVAVVVRIRSYLSGNIDR